jgi:hypothetical protein
VTEALVKGVSMLLLATRGHVRQAMRWGEVSARSACLEVAPLPEDEEADEADACGCG